MEAVLSAAAGDLVSRFFSFLVNMYWDPARLEEKHMERLQHLLLRAHTVVEEADGRYITNSGMLIQLRMLARAMYQGYHVLDTFKCNQLVKDNSEEVMDGSLVSYIGTPLKRFRANAGISNHKVDSCCDLQGALLNLETVISNINEFVILLSGCERMVRTPYDTYLYVDNFMFSRRTEMQQVINFLLQHNPLGSSPVLPIIGGSLVGKKTLVTHVWNDEKVRSYFSSIVCLNEANFTKIDTERCTSGRTLVVVTFVSDVDDEDWKSFYRAVASIRIESKVIIISRMESLTRYGTVKPIHLNKLQDDEYTYFFKTLAFGSEHTKDHPNLTLLIGEFIKLLGGSFVGAYSIANILRRDMSIQFWHCILNRYKNVTKTNLSMFGEHLSLRVRIRYPVDFTNFLPAPAAPLLLMPPRTEAEVFKRKLPKIRIGDLVVDPTLRPKGEFDLVTWESQIPPYTEFIYHVPYCAQKHPKTTLRRKRDASICL
ncbi:E3 ubiquitin-protein ligase SINA-like 11 [Hordeum vulgare]|nr:E3 ubiquitin-protein ligase SINA-like 11 [Hordeum vulgare]